MNKQEKNNEDILRRYINPERIEKAPEGFTSKVMSHIQMESVPVKPVSRLKNIGPVPLISVVIIILLILAAFLIPVSDDSTLFTLSQLADNMNFSMPVINFSNILSIHLPGWLPYLFAGIFALTIFDRALDGLFHKNKN